jgi:hypothetical protein
MDNMTTPTSAKTEYYKGYDDPTADMVLEVKGGVKFRVHSWLLKSQRSVHFSSAIHRADRCSQFFRSMPDHDERLCGTSAKEITFDAAPDDLAVLLDILDRRDPEGSYLWAELVAVIELGMKYQFIHLNTLLLEIVAIRRPRGNPWVVFEAASRYGLVSLAKRVILDFDRTDLFSRLPDTIKPNEMQAVTGPFAIALLGSMRDHLNSKTHYCTSPITGKIGHYIKVDWAAVSHSFTLE